MMTTSIYHTGSAPKLKRFRNAEWSRPGLVLLEHGAEELREGETGGLYHGGWAFRKSAFYKVIGYGPHNNGEDQELAGRLSGAGVTECDPCKFADPFYVYRIDNNSYHLSYMDDRGYRDLGGNTDQSQPSKIPIGWSRDWDRLPVIRRFAFGPHVNPKTDDGKMPVEMIGPVDHPGGNGPSNGMYALQKELRKRIDDGLDWVIDQIAASQQGRDAMVLELERSPLRHVVGRGRAAVCSGPQHAFHQFGNAAN